MLQVAVPSNAFKITPGGVITEIIDSTGDGGGNPLTAPRGIAVDGTGNVYVTGLSSDNAFKITPGGVITEIIDSTGDGVNGLFSPQGITVDGSGNVYVAGFTQSRAFKITPGGVITEIIDSTGDTGAVNRFSGPNGIAVDGAENVFVTGLFTDNAFKITPGGVITQIIDSTGDMRCNVLGHFLGYKIKEKGNNPFEPRIVFLKDQFKRGDYNVIEPKELYNPVFKNGEENFDLVTHLKGYLIEGPLKKVKNIKIENQFGEIFVDIKKKG